MGWLEKLFGKEESVEAAGVIDQSIPAMPLSGLAGIRFGRYSDNNKPYRKIRSWFLAEDLFKKKAYADSFAAFFDHISDDEARNVVFRPDGDRFSFEIIQGSRKIYGTCDGETIVARVSIAVMVKPVNAVMRRLLDLNFSLRYSRCALDEGNTLCMVFQTPVRSASPGKLYNGLREVARYADRQDDLLVADFESLEAADLGHIRPLPDAEIDVKFRYFRKWIEDTLQCVSGLNPDSFSGAIAYAYLTLLYRIDFLIVPEARLMADLEAVSNLYWHKKEETTLVMRNALMGTGIRKLLDITREQFAAGLYRSTGTFSFVTPPPTGKTREHVHSANADAVWYVENKYPELALLINEYGIAYNQFSYSMPALLTELATIYMAVVHAPFFRELGMSPGFLHQETGKPHQKLLIAAIDHALGRWKEKYTALHWDHGKVNYNSVWDFAYTFSEQYGSLDLELRR